MNYIYLGLIILLPKQHSFLRSTSLSHHFYRRFYCLGFLSSVVVLFNMKSSVVSLVWALALLAPLASAAIVEHTFNVENMTVTRLCNERVITAVNGTLPGPTIDVQEGDTLIVHVNNLSPYNATIHWHGIFQLLSAWADGPESVTQCPIPPGGNYTYKFNITGQQGTLWWHAHSSWLRATVYGALIIRPPLNQSYPFPTPYQEVPIILGEWWNANVIDVENEAQATGGAPNISDAYTINGLPGSLYNCSQNQTYQVTVKQGMTYLFRIINAALNEQHFFMIANHTFTVVAIDASYTNPYDTDVVVVAPGQTTDVLFTANQTVGAYYMAAAPYHSNNVTINNSTTRGLVVYENASSSATPIMPTLPALNDTATANKFYTNITGLVDGPHWVPVPSNVDENMFITFGVNLDQCNLPGPNNTCDGPNGLRLSASMNNESFVLPSDKNLSMLEAFYSNVSGVYTKDFPSQPPLVFDYTNPDINNLNASIAFAPKSTKVFPLNYNSTVEIVLQNTAILGVENHPIHIHGFNFYVLAQGFGNYNATTDEPKFNLVNPQVRNTIAVPVGGWAVIRFQANNPGIWLVHCHLDVHLPWGLAMAFEIENGGTPSSTLPAPPADLPKC